MSDAGFGPIAAGALPAVVAAFAAIGADATTFGLVALFAVLGMLPPALVGRAAARGARPVSA